MPSSPRKVINKLLSSVLLAGTAAIGWGIVGNWVANKFLPNPEDYAKREGLNYSEETMGELRKLSLARVVERGTADETLYMIARPLNYYYSRDIFASTEVIPRLDPSDNPSTPYVVLPSQSGIARNYALAVHGFPYSNLKLTDRLVQSHILFHELGHVDLYLHTNVNARNTPKPVEEALADKYGIARMSKEFGSLGKSFAVATRATKIDNETHDTIPNIIPYLFHANNGNFDYSDTHKNSLSYLFNKFDTCFITEVEQHPDLGSPLALQQIFTKGAYNCIAKKPPRNDGANFHNPWQVADREKWFMDSYRFLFQNGPLLKLP